MSNILRTVPMHGLESDRQLALANNVILDNELHFTTDQKRLWLGDTFLGPAVWQGVVADEAALLALSGSAERGVWPQDNAYRSDTSSTWLCISNNGADLSDWLEL